MAQGQDMWRWADPINGCAVLGRHWDVVCPALPRRVLPLPLSLPLPLPLG